MAKTKALISFAVTAKVICVFVFAYAKSRFSHDAAQISIDLCFCTAVSDYPLIVVYILEINLTKHEKLRIDLITLNGPILYKYIDIKHITMFFTNNTNKQSEWLDT